MSTAFKSKVEISAKEDVSQVCEKIENRLGAMARSVHERTKFLMNDMASTVGERMQALSNHVKGLWGQSGVMGAIGGALATGGAVASLNELSEKIEHLRMQGAGIGMPVAEMQRWGYAAEQAGVDADLLTRGLAKMGETAFEVARGKAKDQAELFKQMGVAVKDAKGNVRGITEVAMDVATRFKEHMDRINKLRDHGNASLAGQLESESNNAAQKLFGMKAREVAALMAQGKVGIRKAFAEADGTGGVLSDEQVEKVEKYAKALKKLDFAKQGLMVTLFGDKMEWLATKTSGLASKIGAFEKAHPALFKMASGAIAAAGGLVALASAARLAQMGFAFLAGGQLVGEIRAVGLASALSGRMVGLLRGALSAAGSAFRLIGAASPWMWALAAAAGLMYYNWDKIQPVLEKVWDNLRGVWDAVEPILAAFGNAVWSTFSEVLSTVWGAVKGVWDAFAQLLPSTSQVSGALDGVGGKFQFVADVAEFLREALDVVKIGAELALIPFRLLATSLEAVADKIKGVASAWKQGGIFSAIGRFFNLKEDVTQFATRAHQNFGGVGTRMAAAGKDLWNAQSHPFTAEEMRERAHENTRLLARVPVRTPGEKPQEVKMAGPVEVSTKGKLGIDMHVSLDQGLKLTQSGVDKSGAPNIVGDVGVSSVKP